MIELIFLISLIGVMITGTKLYPEFEGAIISLGITILSGVGIIYKKLYLKIFVKNPIAIMLINWFFFILGITLTIAYLTIWFG
jgi:hypothetical protein